MENAWSPFIPRAHGFLRWLVTYIHFNPSSPSLSPPYPSHVSMTYIPCIWHWARSNAFLICGPEVTFELSKTSQSIAWFAQLRIKQVCYKEGEQVKSGENFRAGFLSLLQCLARRFSCACFQSCGKRTFWTVSSWTSYPRGPLAWRTCSSGRDFASLPYSAACQVCHWWRS